MSAILRLATTGTRTRANERNPTSPRARGLRAANFSPASIRRAAAAWAPAMPSVANKRRLRARVKITEESLSEDESEAELEIEGPVQTDFVPAWVASAVAPCDESGPHDQPLELAKLQAQPQKKKPKKQKLEPPVQQPMEKKPKKPKLTKEERAAVGPPAWRQESATCPSCVIKPVPGKGRGLVCTRQIKAGELVVGELPAVHW